MKASRGGLGARRCVWRELREGQTLQRKLDGRSHLAGLSEFSSFVVSEKTKQSKQTKKTDHNSLHLFA